MTIKKRDGRIEEFNEVKIANAIRKASDSSASETKLTDNDVEQIMTLVRLSLKERQNETKPIPVKDIQKPKTTSDEE